MPGRPLRRARRAATGDANGKIAPPRRLRAGLSPVAWRRLSPVEKLQSLYGLSLDAALEDLSYRGDDPHRLAARTSARPRERERVLRELEYIAQQRPRRFPLPERGRPQMETGPSPTRVGATRLRRFRSFGQHPFQSFEVWPFAACRGGLRIRDWTIAASLNERLTDGKFYPGACPAWPRPSIRGVRRFLLGGARRTARKDFCLRECGRSAPATAARVHPVSRRRNRRAHGGRKSAARAMEPLARRRDGMA